MSKRRSKIPIARALKKIREARPRTHKDFKAIGLPLRWIGTGAFRECCEVLNCDLVVKFPLPRKKGVSGKRHTATEMARLKRLRKHRVMLPHLPEVFYYDKTHGIIVMRKYPKYDSFEDQADAMGQMIQRLIYAVTRVKCQDIHTENVRKRRMNHEGAVLIDLGY